MKKAPVVIQIYESEQSKADLVKELDIDKHKIDKEILQQPSKYVWWATLYAKVSEKVDKYQEELEHQESLLHNKYSDAGFKATEIKHKIRVHPEYMRMLRRLRHWKNSERILKNAERAFSQRASMLQSYAANTRRERKVVEEE